MWWIGYCLGPFVGVFLVIDLLRLLATHYHKSKVARLIRPYPLPGFYPKTRLTKERYRAIVALRNEHRDESQEGLLDIIQKKGEIKNVQNVDTIRYALLADRAGYLEESVSSEIIDLHPALLSRKLYRHYKTLLDQKIENYKARRARPDTRSLVDKKGVSNGL